MSEASFLDRFAEDLVRLISPPSAADLDEFFKT